MAEYKDFNVDFIDRTLRILKEYTGEYEVTMMINCAVGLLMIPQQNLSRLIPRIAIDSSEVFGIRRRNIGRCNGGYRISNVLRHMRNGISHGHITQYASMKGEIETIRIQDILDDNCTFEVILTPIELKKFSIYIAEEILKTKKL